MRWLPFNWAILERLFPLTFGFFLSGRSSHLPDEARERYCWNNLNVHCQATNCQAWRWNRHPFSWRGLFTKRRGRCDISAFRHIPR
jgi:hypothetical protein